MNSFLERFRYWFDNAMSKGLASLIGLLLVITLVFVGVMTVLVVAFSAYPEPSESFGEMLWFSLMHALDPGTVVGDSGFAFRTIMLITTFGGLVFLAGLIGIISGAFDAKVEALRKGRSRVLETDHTLILGWNSRVFSLISELSIANQSRKKASIVILADRDKVEMEDEIREQVTNTFKTKVVVRTGDPMQLSDLELVNHQGARSVIVLASDDSDNADLATIKTCLALVNNPNRKSEKYQIVAEIKDEENLEAARLVSETEVKWILASDVMSRIMVQTARQSGLSQIFLELLDFDGDEIYFQDANQLAGSTYLKAQHAYSNSTLIGLYRDGQVLLNQKPASKIKASDELILVAPDDSEIKTEDFSSIDRALLSITKPSAQKPDKTLILGTSDNLPVIISELGEYVAKGSSVTIVAKSQDHKIGSKPNLKVNFIQGDATSRQLLDSLNVSSFDHIVVLANRELSDEAADALTLITLLQLRDMARDLGKSFNIVSEMLNDKNRKLAESTEADDFIVSDQLIGLMMSQISENQKLSDVFRYLFSSEGSEISLLPASWFVKLDTEVDMHVLVEAAAKRGETALGYRLKALEGDSESRFGIVLNPDKSNKFKLGSEDRVIVLAEG